MLDTDRVKRPGVERLRDVLAKQNCWLPEEHEPTELALAKGAHFQESRKHIASEFTAGSIRASIGFGVACAQIWIDLVVRRGQVELRIAPQSIFRKEGTVRRIGH